MENDAADRGWAAAEKQETWDENDYKNNYSKEDLKRWAECEVYQQA